jgi:hypothetical protein
MREARDPASGKHYQASSVVNFQHKRSLLERLVCHICSAKASLVEGTARQPHFRARHELLQDRSSCPQKSAKSTEEYITQGIQRGYLRTELEYKKKQSKRRSGSGRTPVNTAKKSTGSLVHHLMNHICEVGIGPLLKMRFGSKRKSIPGSEFILGSRAITLDHVGNIVVIMGEVHCSNPPQNGHSYISLKYADSTSILVPADLSKAKIEDHYIIARGEVRTNSNGQPYLKVSSCRDFETRPKTKRASEALTIIYNLHNKSLSAS